MKLLYQTHSPYARKVLVMAHEIGLADRLTVVHHETSPTLQNAEVFALNPLGKVPVLLRDDGDVLFDSDVICRYLDTLHAGSPLFPVRGETIWSALQCQAVAQGICDAGIAVRWEDVRRPPDLRYAPLRDGYALKLRESYAWLDANLPQASLNIGHIAIATALDWIEFRELPGFRSHRRLSEWLDVFRERPSMRATVLFGDTADALSD